MRTFVALAAFVAVNAFAAPQSKIYAEGDDGSRIRFHTDNSTGCVDGAKRADWQSADAQRVVLGCWRDVGGGQILVALRNGYAFVVPLTALKEAKEL